jgi:hypothetical protein
VEVNVSRGPHNFKLNDATRFMKAHAKAAGLPVERLRYVLDPKTGRITGDVRNEGEAVAGKNPWDKVLKNAPDKKRPT